MLKIGDRLEQACLEQQMRLTLSADERHLLPNFYFLGGDLAIEDCQQIHKFAEMEERINAR